MAWLLYFMTGLSVFNTCNRKPVFYDHGVFYSTVMEIPVEKKNSVQTILKLQFIKDGKNFVQTDEKISAMFEKSECSLKLEPGDNVVFKRVPQFIKNSGNPFEFDYKKYLARKGIYRQTYLQDGVWNVYNSESHAGAAVWAERLRMTLLNVYRQSCLSEKHKNILAALTLGFKGGLDPETRQTFASAGAIHVLAVSGLHVGIVFMVFSFIFGFLRITRYGSVLRLFISLGCLWFFAFLTGLSPSVTRASLMLTFFVVGRNMNRRANIYNNLAASAFFLLLFNPNSLFDAGFQFSYSAVFGIVFLQPRIEKLIHFRFRVIQYLWSLLSVSLAAQMATFPLSVYYFDQFPVYFLISNLFIIPAVTIVVPAGFILLAFHWCPGIFRFLSVVTDKFFDLILGFLKTIELMPYSVVHIYLSVTEIIFVCSVLVSLFFLIKTMKTFYLKSMLFSVFMMISVSLVTKLKTICRQEINVYNLRGAVVMHLIDGNRNYIISYGEIKPIDYNYGTIIRTAGKLKLDKPLFLTTESKFKDGSLCMYNDILSFKGRIICITGKSVSLPDNLNYDIIISTLKNFSLNLISHKRAVTVVTKMRINNNLPMNINVHCLEERGAFREKW